MNKTPYDILNEENPDYYDARRRLLLLAGALSLHPETRKQLNYQARKGALLAFITPMRQRHGQDLHVRSTADICYHLSLMVIETAEPTHPSELVAVCKTET